MSFTCSVRRIRQYIFTQQSQSVLLKNREFYGFILFLPSLMRFSLRPFLFVVLLLSAFYSCSPYEQVRKSTDINYKLTKANEYYDRKWYHRANELYRDLLPVMKGTKNYEAMFYRMAYTFYYTKDYLSASLYFKTFVDYFPNSKDAEEAQFLQAVSLYKVAPKASLEQTNTIKAMEAMQSFINQHPESKYIAEANTYIETARKKLEEKEASAARLYYNIGQFKAASIAYKEVMNTYPESPNSDLYEYMIVRSLYRYAKASVDTKQEERFANAVSAHNDFKQMFPNSRYLQESEQLHISADNKIKKIRNEQ
jgi:outer membrane protein assembly factor BamD